MGDQILLIDSDLFILLSSAQLLDRVSELLGIHTANLRRLDALPHMLRKPGRSMRRKYPQAVMDQALLDCDRIKGLTERPVSDEVLSRLLRPEDNIDDGEALLYSIVYERQCWLLGSGDKRAMMGLSQSPDLADIRDGVAGRIISLEVVCELLLKNETVEQVAATLGPLSDINQTLRILFGSGGPYTTEDRLDAVASYRRDLEKQVGDDFLFTV